MRPPARDPAGCARGEGGEGCVWVRGVPLCGRGVRAVCLCGRCVRVRRMCALEWGAGVCIGGAGYV